MNDLYIEPSRKSLEVKCIHGEISFTGNSILSDPKAFFGRVFDWIHEYLNYPAETTVVNFRLDYVDTASVQQILELITHLKELRTGGHKLVVNWYYEMNDPELLELGEIMDGRLGLDFNFIRC